MLDKLLEELRNTYTLDLRVELVQVKDTHALGTVLGVDDMGSIMVFWDNGSSLKVIYDEDKVCLRPKNISKKYTQLTCY